jgi:hypothetical protein
MGQLEDRFGDDESANVRAVMLIVAVDYLDDEGEPSTKVRWDTSQGMPQHETVGLLEYVKTHTY